MQFRQEWQNQNSNREYPFIAYSNDELLPTYLITDLKLRYDGAYGEQIFLSICSVTNNAVSVVLSAFEGGTDEPVDILAGTFKKPVVIGQTYALDALVDNAAGWISFGEGIAQHNDIRFTDDTGLYRVGPQAYSPFPASGITGFRLENEAQVLSGRVSIVGASGNLSVRTEYVEDPPKSIIQTLKKGNNGITEEIMNFSLKVGGVVSNNLITYANGVMEPYELVRDGIESREAIQYIGPVYPDCNGVINLEFRGFGNVGAMLPIEDESLSASWGDSVNPVGITFGVNATLDDVCGASDYSANLVDPECSYSYSSLSYTPATGYTSPSYPPIEEVSTTSSTAEYPINIGSLSLTHVIGAWTVGGTVTCDTVNGLAGPNYSIVDRIDTDIQDRSMSATFQLKSNSVGAYHNFALMTAIRPLTDTIADITALGAWVDWDGLLAGAKALVLARWTGASWIPIQAVTVPSLALDADYTLEFNVGTTSLELVLTDSGATEVGRIDIASYANLGPNYGYMGLYSRQSGVVISSLTITNT